MADNRCPVCGKKVGLFGELAPDQIMINKGKKYGVYQEKICLTCLAEQIAPYEEQERKLQEERQQILPQLIASALPLVFMSPSVAPQGVSDLGIVTGYCIMGTGPVTTLTSAVTDLFGQQSNAYIEKIHAAEQAAFNMLKLNALKKGGDAVYSCHVNLSEATSGHGMIMLSVYGTAVRTENPDENLLKAIEILKT